MKTGGTNAGEHFRDKEGFCQREPNQKARAILAAPTKRTEVAVRFGARRVVFRNDLCTGSLVTAVVSPGPVRGLWSRPKKLGKLGEAGDG